MKIITDSNSIAKIQLMAKKILKSKNKEYNDFCDELYENENALKRSLLTSLAEDSCRHKGEKLANKKQTKYLKELDKKLRFYEYCIRSFIDFSAFKNQNIIFELDKYETESFINYVKHFKVDVTTYHHNPANNEEKEINTNIINS